MESDQVEIAIKLSARKIWGQLRLLKSDQVKCLKAPGVLEKKTLGVLGKRGETSEEEGGLLPVAPREREEPLQVFTPICLSICLGDLNLNHLVFAAEEISESGPLGVVLLSRQKCPGD